MGFKKIFATMLVLCITASNVGLAQETWVFTKSSVSQAPTYVQNVQPYSYNAVYTQAPATPNYAYNTGYAQVPVTQNYAYNTVSPQVPVAQNYTYNTPVYQDPVYYGQTQYQGQAVAVEETKMVQEKTSFSDKHPILSSIGVGALVIGAIATGVLLSDDEPPRRHHGDGHRPPHRRG